MTRRRFALGVALLWLAAAAAYLIAWWPNVAAWGFPDPDDQLRLVEVRDFLGGQAWRDVSQHRLNAPWGAPMHWSRLVDLPIAGVILLLGPLLGAASAEMAALVIVPALTLGIAMLLAALIGRRLISPAAGLGCALLLPLTTGALQQLRPLRIDHHGWQMVLALGIVLAFLHARNGARIAGALAAVWLTVSLEGLPFCAGAGVLLGCHWLRDPADARVADYAGTLAATLAALFTLTRPGAAWSAIACDAVSPVHLALVGLAALGTLAAMPLPRRPALVLLALTGGACAALYLGVAPACTKGAFAALDPLVTRYWYANVSEGMPVWRLSAGSAGAAIGFPLLGLVGAALHLRRAADRQRWLDYALLLLVATLVTAFVQRAGAVANVLALPAGVTLMQATFARLDRLRPGPGRVLASAAGLSLLLPPAPALAAQLIGSWGRTEPEPAADKPACGTTRDFATAAALPLSALMTNIDIGPGILVTTRHSVVASGHHRNVAGLHDAIATFTGSPAQARAILAARGIDYLVVCATMAELDLYRKASPRGFWAQLAAGRRFAWAQPVRLPGSPLSVWRIRR